MTATSGSTPGSPQRSTPGSPPRRTPQHTPLPYDVVRLLMSSTPTSPRLTWYGPSPGERIELSGRVLGNWVSKAANLLRDELDAAEGTVLRLALPTGHWRGLYWALATWAVGATLSVTGQPADVVVTTSEASAPSPGEILVIVSLPILGRSGPVPAGAIDESTELPVQPDDFIPSAPPDTQGPALVGATQSWSFGAVVPAGSGTQRLALATDGDPADLLRACLGIWAGDGSVVLIAGDHPRRADVLLSEGISQGRTTEL